LATYLSENHVESLTTIAQSYHDVTAAILAGGLGTRLRPALEGIPKVLARVGNRPFITFLLDQLVAAGIKRAVLLTGYRAEQVEQTLGNRYDGMSLSYSVEESPLGTAGALRRSLPQLKTETVLLMNGDSFCDVDVPGLVTAHRRRRAELTMALTHVPDASHFGQVKMVVNGKVTHFGEKQDGAGPGWVNAGVYIMAKSLIAEIPAAGSYSLERDLLPGWVKSRRIYGVKGSGRFLDIGTPASYAGAPAFFAS
jgi:D-glycero-alpha-D-manno-heptose 1-phosphate guanylyltransferase